jgi:hypothetical protein
MDEEYLFYQLEKTIAGYIPTKIKDCYGLGYSFKILNHVNNFIVLEGIKNQRIILILRCSALLCSIFTFFLKKNIKKILLDIFPPNNKKIIKDICDVVKITQMESIQMNKIEEWKLIPRYSSKLEQIGEDGFIRLYSYFTNYKKLSFSEISEKFKYHQNEIYKELNNSGLSYFISSSREKVDSFNINYFSEENLKKMKKKTFNN